VISEFDIFVFICLIVLGCVLINFIVQKNNKNDTNGLDKARYKVKKIYEKHNFHESKVFHLIMNQKSNKHRDANREFFFHTYVRLTVAFDLEHKQIALFKPDEFLCKIFNLDQIEEIVIIDYPSKEMNGNISDMLIGIATGNILSGFINSVKTVNAGKYISLYLVIKFVDNTIEPFFWHLEYIENGHPSSEYLKCKTFANSVIDYFNAERTKYFTIS